MACRAIKVGDSAALSCRHPARRSCFYCGAEADRLCDFPIGRRMKNGKFKTCDRRMCASCTQRGASGKTDFCTQHFDRAKKAHERRIKRADAARSLIYKLR